MTGYRLLQALSHCDLSQKIEVMCDDNVFELKAVIPEEWADTKEKVIMLYIEKKEA